MEKDRKDKERRRGESSQKKEERKRRRGKEVERQKGRCLQKRVKKHPDVGSS